MTKGHEKTFSLYLKYAIVLLAALAVGAGTTFLTQRLGYEAISAIYCSEAMTKSRCSHAMDDLQGFVEQKGIGTRDVLELKRWSMGQNQIYFMVSDSEEILFSSGWWDEPNYYYSIYESDDEASAAHVQDMEAGLFDGDESYFYEEFADGTISAPITFADGTYMVTIMDYSENSLYNVVEVSAYVVGVLAIFVVMLIYFQTLIQRIVRLNAQVETIAHGDLEGPISMKNRDELGLLAEHVDQMRNSIIHEMSEEQQAWNANSDLIRRISHDIRTPLTVLMGFLSLIDEGGFSEDEAYRSYLEICKKNAFQLKELTDKLFQYFLAFGHQEERKLEEVDAKVAVLQIVSEHILLLSEEGWQVDVVNSEHSCRICIDDRLVKRYFDNIFSNIKKYADPAYPVRAVAKLEEGRYSITVTNHVRPDPDRAESTYIGLKTCERIAELMKGGFTGRQEGEEFIASIWLPALPETDGAK